MGGIVGTIVTIIVLALIVQLILEIGIWWTLAIAVVIGIIYFVVSFKQYSSSHNSSGVGSDWRRAAEEGHAASQYLMGNSYMDAYRSGVGDREEALKSARYWYGKAMAQGYDLDPDARDIATGKNPPSWW